MIQKRANDSGRWGEGHDYLAGRHEASTNRPPDPDASAAYRRGYEDGRAALNPPSTPTEGQAT